jgi:hypothetical protein
VRVTMCISAVQHLRRLRGGAQSHLLRASDGAVLRNQVPEQPPAHQSACERNAGYPAGFGTTRSDDGYRWFWRQFTTTPEHRRASVKEVSFFAIRAAADARLCKSLEGTLGDLLMIPGPFGLRWREQLLPERAVVSRRSIPSKSSPELSEDSRCNRV